ncbi:hypothetical protein [Devosia sp.]|uniref:hypothetical protein n=1 Tax=Devosia sp. TaxID=1871048 RepID=UPI00261F6F90|nr:hypothetical protein [Devosia sp.]
MKTATIETGPDIREAFVPAALQTWAGFLHQLDTNAPNPGRERAMVDRKTLMGGACRFHCTPSQEEAAARFRAIYERSQVGGAKAVDPSREAVDGGGINPESVIEIGADARASYNRLFTALGLPKMRCLEFVVIGEHGPTAYARWRYRNNKPNARIVADGMVEIRGVLEEVAIVERLQNRRAA